MSSDVERLNLTGENCKEPLTVDGDYTLEIISLAMLISINIMTSTEVRGESLMTISENRSECQLLNLMRANAGLCIYRRLCSFDPGASSEHLKMITRMGEEALLPAQALVLTNRVWWDVLTVPFHYICVLLHINSIESLSQLAGGMSALRKFTRLLGTHMAREAQLVAESLVKVCSQRKQEEMRCLNAQLSIGAEIDTHDICLLSRFTMTLQRHSWLVGTAKNADGRMVC